MLNFRVTFTLVAPIKEVRIKWNFRILDYKKVDVYSIKSFKVAIFTMAFRIVYCKYYL